MAASTHVRLAARARASSTSAPSACSAGAGALRVALLLGSTRTEGPPHPAPLGARVGAFVAAELRARGHAVDVVDPLLEQLPLLVKPHFAYAPGRAPAHLDALAARLASADCYVAVRRRAQARATARLNSATLAPHP